MKTSMMLCLVFGLIGCGSDGTPNEPTAKSAGGVTTVSYTLNATRTYPADTATDGTTTLPVDARISVPASLTLTQNATEAGRATLNLGGVQCYYYYNASDSPIDYTLNSCTGGYVAGDVVSLSSGSVVSLTVQDGYCTQTTVVQADLSGTT